MKVIALRRFTIEQVAFSATYYLFLSVQGIRVSHNKPQELTGYTVMLLEKYGAAQSFGGPQLSYKR